VRFPDANLPLYTEDTLSPHHEQARAWWNGVLSGREAVLLRWPVLNALPRIATNTIREELESALVIIEDEVV
jgi:predicted nucleic acid-binding protein